MVIPQVPSKVIPGSSGYDIVCVDCGEVFVFDEGEQRFFYERELFPPKRCPMCRKWRRQVTQ